VPLHLDGVPAYAPLDGFVDLSRYLTSDVAEIQVAKGYSSPLLGPNLLGGVVNLVTRQPQKPFEADSLVGTGPGGLLNSGLHLGSRWRQFFFQGAIDRLQSHFYPLSDAVTLNATQPTDHRVNSAQRDERYRLRVGWSPRNQDSYAVSYSNQRGKSGVPPYSGSSPVCPTGNAATLTVPCVTPKYWRWPTWNTDSLYFNSRTALSRDTAVQFRAFYVRYANNQSMFDDATYTTMNVNANSGILNNHDHSFGLSGDFETRRFSRNTIGASFFVNNDTHREQTTTFSKANVPTATALQTDRDRQSSFGLQDIVKISSRLSATLGISADNLNGLQAQDLSTDKTFVVPFQVAGICAASTPPSFKDCTDHVWTYNPVGSLSYQTEKSGTLFFTAAEKSRFPTVKDRYSYKAGRAIPNPALKPEHARTWTAGYSRAFARRTLGQIDLFRSDLRDGIQNTFFLSPLCSGGGKGGAGTCQQAVNVASEVHNGLNVSVRSTPVTRLTVEANYSYVLRKIDGASGVFSTGVPKHKSVATLTMRLPRGATALVSERYQSGAVGMADNSLRLPVSKFARTDIGGTLPIRLGFRVQLGIENLFDRNYFYWEGFPEAGRNWYGTLRYTF
jgi:iron complex outermembrane receptor protein